MAFSYLGMGNPNGALGGTQKACLGLGSSVFINGSIGCCGGHLPGFTVTQVDLNDGGVWATDASKTWCDA